MLAKLLKIVKLEYNWQQTFHRHQFLRAKITRATITIGYSIVFMHWIACSWHSLGHRAGVYTWLDDGGIRDAAEITRYVASIYWVVMTLTSVGYGDYTAQSVSEQVFNVCIMLFGCVCYAFFIGRVSIFFIDFNQAKKMKQRALQHLESFMADANIDLELREKCRNATGARVEQMNLLVRAETCLHMLPSALQTEVMLQLHDLVIRKIEVLNEHREIFPQFVAKAASLMQVPLKVRLGELLVQEGSVPEDCYFLVQGNAIIVRGGFPQMELHGGDFFGELECLLGSKRTASVYALSDCLMYTISAENLKYLFRKFPQAAAALKEISTKKREDGISLQKTKKALASTIADELGSGARLSPTGSKANRKSSSMAVEQSSMSPSRNDNGSGKGEQPEILKELQELRKENAGIRSLLARLEEHMGSSSGSGSKASLSASRSKNKGNAL
jgi:CRP-like cAMP-binding protein